MRKQVNVDGIDVPIMLSRRKGTRSIRLAVTAHGSVRLTVPYGIPEFTAIAFAKKKAAWIAQHVKPLTKLQSGDHIGKSHTLYVETAAVSRPSTKVSGVTIRVRFPVDTDVESTEAQNTIRRACEKALLVQAETLLPKRLDILSKQYGVPYTSLKVKKLKSRWGACDSEGNISISIYLIQLPWHIIDYVLCHELAHTKHHNHSADFWNCVETMLPEFKAARSQLKSQPTDVITIGVMTRSV